MAVPQLIILKLFISSILIFILSSQILLAQEMTDSTKISDTSVTASKPKEKHFQYFRVGIDLYKLTSAALNKKYNALEFQLDGVWKKKMHYVLETGFAKANTENENISFKSSSYFLRAGFDKYFFGTLYKGDLDNASIGMRLASARSSRGEAQVKLWDPFYGNQIVTKPADQRMMYWLELVAGFRVELIKNIFVGWNVRAKTFMNPKNIKELSPEYLAGYGNAKKQPSFDYSFYLLYGFGKR